MAETFELTKTDVEEELTRVLSAAVFRSSGVLSRFLEFVVTETLAGKEQEIKEYTIAVHVLSRKLDFNPQLDAIVRTHAGRLRRALKEYYTETGKNDLVRIEIPKGSYIPLFTSQTEIEKEFGEKKKKARSKPVVAVLPFRNTSRDSSRNFFADGLGEQLSTELTGFHDLSVISYYSSRHAAGVTSNLNEVARKLGASYLLTGSIQNDSKHLLVQVQLIFGDSSEQIWATSFKRNNTASDLFAIQNEIVKRVLTAVGGYYGAIYRDVLQAPYHNEVNGMEMYDAIFWYYYYQKEFTSDVYKKTILALTKAVESDPGYALAWAMLGELYVDAKALELVQVNNPLEQALKCALRAVAIDPVCQHGYLALAWIYLFYHDHKECLKAVDQCIAINPNSADMVGAMGFALVCAGEFERGYALLNDSIKHNPFCPWWFHVGFVFYFLYKKEYLTAMHSAEKINMPDLFWDPMLRACALGHLNRIAESGENMERVRKLLSDADEQVKNIIESFLLSTGLHAEILEGLKKAGLESR